VIFDHRRAGRPFAIFGEARAELTDLRAATRVGGGSSAAKLGEAHVGSIRRHLQVRSRAQVAARVSGHRLRSGAAR